MDALMNAPPKTVGKFRWTITDAFDGRGEEPAFIFGRLSKSLDDGHVTIVDPSAKTQMEAIAPNLLKASAPFVFLPDYSGLAYLHVWNDISEDLFEKRVKALIEDAHNNFFAACDIEPISDYTVFVQKLKSLDKFTEISATVFPPNPLFGRLWGSLKKYVDDRNAESVSLTESNEKGSGINTQLVDLVDNILQDPEYEPEEVPAIGDAAILMAADGYGKGRVTGEDNGEEVVIRTADTQKHFKFFKDPDPHELANRAAKAFSSISSERNMTHDQHGKGIH